MTTNIVTEQITAAGRAIEHDSFSIIDAEAGPHDALIQKQQGLYAHLWRMQDGSRAGPPTGSTTPVPEAAA